jgi:hypothetical protein
LTIEDKRIADWAEARLGRRFVDPGLVRRALGRRRRAGI